MSSTAPSTPIQRNISIKTSNVTFDISTSNLVMMVYRQAVFVAGIACLFFFKSPIRDTVLFAKK
jgi:hypothetical protein